MNTPPPRRTGLLHILDAAGYSLAGFRRLLRESAARLELGAAAIGAVLLALAGATLVQFLIYLALCVAVLVVEALNTALEVLTDHVSPGWSQAAKDAKDLGSFAVALTITTVIGYLGFVLLGAFL